MHEWLRSWPTLTLACGLPASRPRPAANPVCLRAVEAGADCRCSGKRGAAHPGSTGRHAVSADWRASSLFIDSAPILAWWRRDPDAQMGHAPAHQPRPLLRGYRVHTLLCRGSGLPLLLLLSPATGHDAPSAHPLLAWAILLYRLRPRILRLDAGSSGLRLIAWMHGVLGAVAVIRLSSPTATQPLVPATHAGLSKQSANARIRSASLGESWRLFSSLRLQRPPWCGASRRSQAGGFEPQPLRLSWP
jgi:hypothetical protein